MAMRERKRRHDDLHRPLGGRGKRHKLCGGYGFPRLVAQPPVEICECGWPKDGEGCRLSHQFSGDT